MIGAIAGDIVGSIYEWNNIKTKKFPLFGSNCDFTDDTVLTVALADSILTGEPYRNNLKRYYVHYPGRGYGGGFRAWAESSSVEPYGSWGNGAAMRISPVGYAYGDIATVLRKAEEFTAVTHNHPEGIKGGQATAAAVFLARTGTSKEGIRAFLDSTDFEDAIRIAISLGGDSDTLACITGGIAQAFYGGVPREIEERLYAILDEDLGRVTRQFMERFRAV